MPALFRLRIILHGDTHFCPDNEPAHEWFLRLISSEGNNWADEIRPPQKTNRQDSKSDTKSGRDDDARPFALSPLYWDYGESLRTIETSALSDRCLLGVRDASPEEVSAYTRRRIAHWRGAIPSYRLYSGQTVTLRVALFREEDIKRFEDILEKRKKPLHLGGAPCDLFRHPSRHNADDPDVWYLPWETVENVSAPDRLVVRFVMPTDFRAEYRNLSECAPADLLQSWSASFTRWAPPDLPLARELKQGAFDFRGLRFARGFSPLRPRAVLIKTTNESRIAKYGYEGACAIEFPDNLAEEVRRAAHALVLWANFSGTGKGTALSLGQTRGGGYARTDPE